jgi:signal transduction histidine kinase
MFCTDILDPSFVLFSSSVPHLLYYTHIPAALISIGLGIFVLRNNRTVSGKTLFVLAAVFLLWVVMNLATWTGNDSRSIAFIWSFFGIVYGLIAIVAVYFFRSITLGSDISFPEKVVYLLLFLPIVALTPSAYNLGIFDLTECGPAENVYFLAYYHLIGAAAFVWILVTGMRELRSRSAESRAQYLLMFVGVEAFLVAFFMTSYISSYLYEVGYTYAFEIEQYGLFGMVFFMALLTYSIVRFKAFAIKLLGAQALMVVLIVLVGSIFFLSQNNENRLLVGITFALISIMGWFLVRTVKVEDQRKEELQIISDSLAKANERLRELDNTKTEFISIASHQLRTPLTAIKGYLSLLLEGSYGTLSAEITDVLEKLNLVNRNLIQLVEDLLNVSRIDAGRIKYSFEPLQIETLVAERVDMFMPIARDRGIELGLRLPKTPLPKLMIDPAKMREAVSNLIDNSIKYTEKGSVVVSVELVADDTVRILVEDTGIGFSKEDGAKLFGKFVRTQETTKVYVSGTGLGLFVGKSFVEAHGGRMWAESDGQGRGSRFYVELPVVNPKVLLESGDVAVVKK